MDPPEHQMNPPPDMRRASSASPGKASSYRPTRTRKPSSAATSKKVHRYDIGHTARPSDVNIFQSVDQHVAAVEQLREGGYCFILRSDFRFTYALVLKQEVGVLELQVTEEGGTKTIPQGHWRKYIRTLITDDSPEKQHPAGGHLDERRRHRDEQQPSKQVRRATVANHEGPSPRSINPVTSTGSKKSVSKKESARVSMRSSLPNLDQEGHYRRSQSESIRQHRSLSSSGSDVSSRGVDDSPDSTRSSTLPKLPFRKDYKRAVSQQDASLKNQSARPRRVTVAEKPVMYSIPSIPTKEFKRAVSLQGGDIPLKKCLKQDHHKRSQSESGHHRRYESSESDVSSSSSLASSFSLDSIDDSSLRAQEDLNKLLSKSMPSLKRSIRKEGSLQGAFGDVTKIEILD
mmetsp:Transcript_3468/g.5212  ORF Transcript_3468/g.5212 Transcript_3468/m.5212 type:complete len:402 (-) Transcript_3468:28-1233(-)